MSIMDMQYFHRLDEEKKKHKKKKECKCKCTCDEEDEKPISVGQMTNDGPNSGPSGSNGPW